MTVIGSETSFQSELTIGCSISFLDEATNKKVCLQVTKIKSNTELSIKETQIEQKLDTCVKYQIIPVVNQKEVYEQVIEALLQGEAIGIFPEGCSHDM